MRSIEEVHYDDPFGNRKSFWVIVNKQANRYLFHDGVEGNFLLRYANGEFPLYTSWDAAKKIYDEYPDYVELNQLSRNDRFVLRSAKDIHRIYDVISHFGMSNKIFIIENENNFERTWIDAGSKMYVIKVEPDPNEVPF